MIKKSKCPFANLFGKPGTGVHRFRIFGIAAVDALLTVAAAYFISIKTNKSFVKCAVALVAIGIVVHRALGVNTALNLQIFKDKVCDE